MRAIQPFPLTSKLARWISCAPGCIVKVRIVRLRKRDGKGRLKQYQRGCPQWRVVSLKGGDVLSCHRSWIRAFNQVVNIQTRLLKYFGPQEQSCTSFKNPSSVK